MKPVIGITACHEDEKIYKTNDTYVKAVARAGGIPVLLPIAIYGEDCRRAAELLDGLLLPGGEDTAPQYYGEEPLAQVSCFDRKLDEFELQLLREVTELKKPVLAICRGCQLLNIAFGGTLYQDIPSQCPDAHGHYQHTASRSEPYHTVYTQPGTMLEQVMEKQEFLTNSFHHQAIRDVAKGFTVSARSADNMVEAIECADRWLLGVQWHPECMEEENPLFRRLFCALVQRSQTCSSNR